MMTFADHQVYKLGTPSLGVNTFNNAYQGVMRILGPKIVELTPHSITLVLFDIFELSFRDAVAEDNDNLRESSPVLVQEVDQHFL